MTYRQLRRHLQDMNDILLDDDVTVAWTKEDGTEYIRIDSFDVIKPEDADTLHDDHWVLNVFEGG